MKTSKARGEGEDAEGKGAENCWPRTWRCNPSNVNSGLRELVEVENLLHFKCTHWFSHKIELDAGL
jgi:hypothetical protein